MKRIGTGNHSWQMLAVSAVFLGSGITFGQEPEEGQAVLEEIQ